LFEANKSFPQIEFNNITLPSINKHEAHLSGVCTLNKTDILFCASVEDTPDWTKDGPILGSCVGIYSTTTKKVSAVYFLKNEKGNILKEKIESLDILRKEANVDFILLAVGDNDDGTSRLLQLKWKQS